jgi:predicted MFS family arabinose efflux permease
MPSTSTSTPPPPPPRPAASTPTGPPASPEATRQTPATVLLTVIITVAVALAFADSSIVVLALPDLYSTFDTSIVAVSWVVTAYNVAIAAAALLLVPLAPRLRPSALAVAGFGVFAVASLVCGSAPTFGVLVAARSVQGVGGALLLGAALAVLVGLTGDQRRAISLWGLAASIGAAAGPALGGVLTELLSWRSIFYVQAPVAMLALLALANPRVRRGAVLPRGGRLRWYTWVANLGYVLLFAALVGALFLGVLLVIVVWGLTPIEAALAVSTLPVGALLARPLVPPIPRWLAAAAGGALLGGGLLALALLPDASVAYLTPALAFCGFGLGLLGGILGPMSMPAGTGLLRAANLTIGARHLGFVLGLLLIAPVLAADLETASQDATRAAAQVILDGRVGLRKKVPLVLDMRNDILATPKGRVPNLDSAFEKNGVANDPSLAVVREDLKSALEDTITRAFRPAFAIAAVLGVLATFPALVVALRRRTVRGTP